jgi:hypothetical protein
VQEAQSEQLGPAVRWQLQEPGAAGQREWMRLGLAGQLGRLQRGPEVRLRLGAAAEGRRLQNCLAAHLRLVRRRAVERLGAAGW